MSRSVDRLLLNGQTFLGSRAAANAVLIRGEFGGWRAGLIRAPGDASRPPRHHGQKRKGQRRCRRPPATSFARRGRGQRRPEGPVPRRRRRSPLASSFLPPWI